MIRTLPALGEIDGRPVCQAVLRDGDVSLTVLSLGCITQDWRVHGRPVVLGYAEPAEYLQNPFAFGIVAGRVANRTAFGRFALDGRTVQLASNQGPHHLHGGVRGLGRRNWAMVTEGGDAIRLSYRSPDGEEGYPGTVDFTVTVRLEGYRVSYRMQAMPDRETPVNLAQHSYYNLAGGGSIWSHELWIAAPAYTVTDSQHIPTGETAPVAGTRYDFTRPRTLGEADPAPLGTDINLVLDDGRAPEEPAAVLRGGGLALRLWTDQPGLQLYNAMHMGDVPGGHDAQTYGRFGGLCLEAQHFPDALNHPQFPSVLCAPDRPYRQDLQVEVVPEVGP